MERSLLVDAARGSALAMMVVYHLCFDLAYFGFTDWDFYRQPFWLHWRTLILSSFLLLVGVSLVLAQRGGFRPRAYARRLAQVAAGALAVSAATWWLFAEHWVSFGVLHFIVVASLLALPLVARPRMALVLGLLALALGNLISHPWFDAGPTRWWIGLMTHRPPTEDYVPLLPWMGVVLLGIPLGHRLLDAGALAERAHRDAGTAPMRWLAWTGRHTLIIYLMHQPVLMGLVWGVSQVM